MFFYWHSRASNSEVKSLIWSEFKLIPDFMSVLVICMFEDDSVKSEVAILQTTFSPICKSMEKFFILQGGVTPK